MPRRAPSPSARRQAREVRCVPCDDAGNEIPTAAAVNARRTRAASRAASATNTAAAGSATLAERPGDSSAPGPASTSAIPSGVPLPFPRAFTGVQARCLNVSEMKHRIGWVSGFRLTATARDELGRSIELRGELVDMRHTVERPEYEEGRDYYLNLAAPSAGEG